MYLFVIFVVAALLQFYAFQGRTSATHVNVLNSHRVTLIVFFILLLLLSIFFYSFGQLCIVRHIYLVEIPACGKVFANAAARRLKQYPICNEIRCCGVHWRPAFWRFHTKCSTYLISNFSQTKFIFFSYTIGNSS